MRHARRQRPLLVCQLLLQVDKQVVAKHQLYTRPPPDLRAQVVHDAIVLERQLLKLLLVLALCIASFRLQDQP